MIPYGYHTSHKHTRSGNSLRHRQRQRGLHAYIINQTSENTRQRINILPENQRLLVNQDIAQHSTKRARDRTHHDRHPHRETELQGLINPNHDKQAQTDRIENKKSVIQMNDISPEHKYE